MPFTSRRTFLVNPLPVDSGVSVYPLTRGMIERGLVISAPYSLAVTTSGTAVRAIAIPIRRVSLVTDNGKYLQSWRARDLVRIAQVFQQAPLAGMVTPPSNYTSGGSPYTGICHVPLFFQQPRSISRDTSLPTWAYTTLNLVIEWGSVQDLLVDGNSNLAGTITFTGPSGGVGGVVVTQLDEADVRLTPAKAAAFVSSQAVNVGRYNELVQAAAANPAGLIDLGTTADIRAILITSELAAVGGGTQGEPTDTIVNAVSLRENNTAYPIKTVPWATIAGDNAKEFGVTMPTGVRVIDFAEDGDFLNVYRASRMQNVNLELNTAAVAGTVRAALLTIEPPKH